MNHSNSAVTLFGVSLLLLTLVCLAPAEAFAQTEAQNREQAIALFEANNFVSALPLLERAALDYPKDPVIVSKLGFTLFAIGGATNDQTLRKKNWERARKVLLQSQALGDNSNLTRVTLESLSKDAPTEMAPFSNTKAAEDEIRKGEAAFVRGDTEQALVAYKRALELDPQLYEAALYAGDMEFRLAHASRDSRFRKEHFEQAGVWFAKAIAIDPNRETAYRYWGDALDQEGKTEAARDKFVDAIVAEPYSGKRAYVGLTQWAERHQVSLGHPKLDIPTNLSSKKPGEVNITLDMSMLSAKDDGSAAWMIYGIVRAGWLDKKDGGLSEKYTKAYPNETRYRHSLAEEMDALRAVMESVRVQMKDKTAKKLTPALEKLMQLSDSGLLEANILFARPDEGIVRDYVTYRNANREKLKDYWLKFVVGTK